MFSWFWQWNKFENRSRFDEVKAYGTKCASFLDHPSFMFYCIPVYLCRFCVAYCLCLWRSDAKNKRRLENEFIVFGEVSRQLFAVHSISFICRFLCRSRHAAKYLHNNPRPDDLPDTYQRYVVRVLSMAAAGRDGSSRDVDGLCRRWRSSRHYTTLVDHSRPTHRWIDQDCNVSFAVYTVVMSVLPFWNCVGT